MRWSLFLLPVALASCGKSAENKEAERLEAVAEVKANQKPPAEKLRLDAIRYPEIEKYALSGAGCSFAPDGGGLGAVAIAREDKGYLLRKGELLILASDMGSAELPYGARAKYDGREYGIILELDDAGSHSSAQEIGNYRGSLTVKDGSDRTVYSAKGILQCGA